MERVMEMDKNRNYYKKEMDAILTELYKHEKPKNQKLYETIFITIIVILIFFPMLTFGVAVAIFPEKLYIYIFVLLGWGLLPILAIARKKKVKKDLYTVPEADKLCNIIELDSSTIDELKENDSLVFYGNPDSEFLEFLYNILNHFNILKQKNINLYTLKIKDIRDNYHFDDKQLIGNELPNEKDIFCIKISNLNINDENMYQFSSIRKILKLQYFDDFSKYVCETKMTY